MTTKTGYWPEPKSWTWIDLPRDYYCRLSSSRTERVARNFPIQCTQMSGRVYRPSHSSRISFICNLTEIDAHRASLQSHSAGQSNFPQISCTKPRECLSSALSKEDGRKSWLTQVVTRSFRVDVSSPRAASAPLLSWKRTRIQRDEHWGWRHAPFSAYLRHHRRRVLKVCDGAKAQPAKVWCNRVASDLLWRIELNMVRNQKDNVLCSVIHRTLLVPPVIFGNQVFQASVENNHTANCPALRNVVGCLSVGANEPEG